MLPHGHKQLQEFGIDTPEAIGDCYKTKFRLHHLRSVENYNWVMFIDVDCIVSTPLDNWFTGPEIVRYVTEPRLPIQLSQFSGYQTDDEMGNLNQDEFNAVSTSSMRNIFTSSSPNRNG